MLHLLRFSGPAILVTIVEQSFGEHLIGANDAQLV